MRLKSIALTVLVTATIASRAGAAVVAHYAFDEVPGATTAVDTVAAKNGLLSGTVAFAGGGISGNAASFTGSTGLINMGQNFGALPAAASGFTLSVWVKTAATAGVIPVAKHDAGYLNGYLLQVNDINSGAGAAANTKAGAYVSSPGVTQPLSLTVVNDNSWHLLTMTYVLSGNLSLYVDGAFQSASGAPTYVPNTSAFTVGGFGQTFGNNTPQPAYTGLVDDVQLYDTALAPTQVAFLFANPGAVVPEPAAIAGVLPAAALLLRRRQ